MQANITLTSDNIKEDVDAKAKEASNAFKKYEAISSQERIHFLNTVIEELESRKNRIIQTAGVETNLPSGRLENEFNRTISQIRLFCSVIMEENWKELSIDLKKDNDGHVISDIRKLNVPIGPVAVFGSSNFPLAFSVAGGDTISALAAGCPVIVKGHNGHIETSKIVAEAISSAGDKTGMPYGFFAILFDEGYAKGIELVAHPLIKAVGFTGSVKGGKALIDAVSKRKEPIPVYAEMGSLNPVVLFPEELDKHPEKWAQIFAGSITMGCGQFCTKPGLFFAIENNSLNNFIHHLQNEMSKIEVHPMLNRQIKESFINKLSNDIFKNKSVEYHKIADAQVSQDSSIHTSFAVVSGESFIKEESLREEFFGPFAVIVKCRNETELAKALTVLDGQLTATVVASESELNTYQAIVNLLKLKVGRVVFNGVPTGVEVCYSINHGGPFPASSSIQSTSVGADAIKRFVRPLCYQNWPQSQLPRELRNDNVTGCVEELTVSIQ